MELPTEQECLDLFREYKVPQNILAHCQKVREVSVFIGKKLGLPDLELLDRAALLHDLFKAVMIKDLVNNNPIHKYKANEEEIAMWKELRSKYLGLHESQVFEIVFKEKYPELTKFIVEAAKLNNKKKSLGEKILHYVDNRIMANQLVSLQEKKNYCLQAYSEHAEKIETDDQLTKEDEKEIFKKLGFEPEELDEKMKNE